MVCGCSGVRGRRALLFASVSVLAIATASPAVYAADGVPQKEWIWWVEGGAFSTGGNGVNFGGFPFLPSFIDIKPKMGWEGAVGFDYSPAAFSPYHISGQFRYGAAKRKSKPFSQNATITSFSFITRTTTAYFTATGSAELKEHHWLVDFAVGRDFRLGSGEAQAKFGIRVADIQAKVTGSGVVCGSNTSSGCGGGGSPITGVFSFTSRSRFLGVGPRLGIDGSIPLGGMWAFDYLGGVAVLFGKRSFDSNSTLTMTINPPGGGTGTLSTATSSSSVGAVFNLDAQAGISYWFNPNFKLSVSYRFDGYWNALRTLNAAGAFVNEDRFYYGPMLRATATF